MEHFPNSKIANIFSKSYQRRKNSPTSLKLTYAAGKRTSKSNSNSNNL